MRSATDALRAATVALTAVSDTPRLDAELLLAHSLNVTRGSLLLGPPAIAPDGFAALVERRLGHEPVAYIVGQRAFWTVELDVGPGVLIPRADSETLIEAAVAHFGAEGPRRVLDLGTGSGALLLAALAHWPDATGLGVDRSAAALTIARANGMRIAPRRATFAEGEWSGGIVDRFDLVLCNPPYVEQGAVLDRQVREWEPEDALFGGEDGLSAYRVLAPQFPRLLAPAGIACIEVGAGQAEAVAALLTKEGLRLAYRSDLGGHIRCLVAHV